MSDQEGAATPAGPTSPGFPEASLLDRFLAMEESTGLFTRTIAEVDYWLNLRTWVYVEVQSSAYDYSVPSFTKKPTLGRQLGLFWRLLKGAISRPAIRGLDEQDILIFHMGGQVRDGATYRDRHTDDLIDALPYRIQVFESPAEARHRTPLFRDGVRYLDDLMLMEFRRRLIAKASWHREALEEIAFIQTTLQEHLGVRVGDHTLRSLIDIAVGYEHFIGPVFDRLLARTRPKVILYTVGYHILHQTLRRAALRKGILTVEIQHGVLNDNNVAYRFPPSAPKSVYPDHLFIYGEYWRSETRLPIPDDAIRLGGYPHLERRLGMVPEQVSAPREILFISQPTISGHLTRFACELAAGLDPSAWRVVYKLHPGELVGWQSAFPHLAKAPLQVVDDLEQDIYHYLGRCALVVGSYSAAIYEGLGLGRPTVVTTGPGEVNVKRLVEEGAVRPVASPTELLTILAVDDLDGLIENAIDPAEFFAPGATARLVKEVHRLCGYGDPERN